MTTKIKLIVCYNDGSQYLFFGECDTIVFNTNPGERMEMFSSASGVRVRDSSIMTSRPSLDIEIKGLVGNPIPAEIGGGKVPVGRMLFSDDGVNVEPPEPPATSRFAELLFEEEKK